MEESFGLFVEPVLDSTAIQQMIDYGQEVSHWVAGEIVACSNPKVSQVHVNFLCQTCIFF